MPFQNRREAGEKLAAFLSQQPFNRSSTVVFGLARGGVPIGIQVAEKLEVPFDVLIVRKIGAPGNPEYGIGACAENNECWINQEAADGVGATEVDIKNTIEEEQQEIQKRVGLYRDNQPHLSVKNKTVIVTDDGLATGVSAKVACKYLKKSGAKDVILAVPVAAAQSADELRSQGQTVICLEEPDYFFSVGQFYEDFSQTTDEEVIAEIHRNSEVHRNKPHGLSELSEQFQISEEVEIPIPDSRQYLKGFFSLPSASHGIVIFVHGSGSGRKSPRNLEVARVLNDVGLGTLLFDLLTEEEAQDRRNVFDIPLLAQRLKLATYFIRSQGLSDDLPIGYFGASTGAAAALWAAADLGKQITAVVSRGGRPDLATTRLPDVTAPTLLMVGSLDSPVIEMNQTALPFVPHADLLIIEGATHLFEEPGTLLEVAENAGRWFKHYFQALKASSDSGSASGLNSDNNISKAA